MNKILLLSFLLLFCAQTSYAQIYQTSPGMRSPNMPSIPVIIPPNPSLQLSPNLQTPNTVPSIPNLTVPSITPTQINPDQKITPSNTLTPLNPISPSTVTPYR